VVLEVEDIVLDIEDLVVFRSRTRGQRSSTSRS